MKRLLSILGILIGLLLLYLLLWPVPIDPASWTPPTAPSKDTGPYGTNNDLSTTQVFSTQAFGEGPEDVAIDSNGYIYGGLLDGKILRYDPDGSNPEVFAETGGRPLGLHFDSLQHLIVADADKGLLSIDSQGQVKLLTDRVNGQRIRFTDDLDIGSDGVIYFSDASDKFNVHSWRADIFEHRANGSLLAYDPHSGETSMLLDDLYFANGIAVSADQQFVLVVETSKYRIQKYWLQGPKAGTTEIFVDNLPGFPDGVSRGDDGIFWVAFPNRRDQALDDLLPQPFVRKIIFRLPEAIQPQQERYGMVLGFDMEGNLRHNLQESSGRLAVITSVQQAGGYLYLGSLSEPVIGRFAFP